MEMKGDSYIWSQISIDSLLAIIAEEKIFTVSVFSHFGKSIEDKCHCRALAYRTASQTYILIHTFLFEDEFGGDIFSTIVLEGDVNFIDSIYKYRNIDVNFCWNKQEINLIDVIVIEIAENGVPYPISSSNALVLKSYSKGNVYECISEMFLSSDKDVWKISLRPNMPDSFILSRIDFDNPVI